MSGAATSKHKAKLVALPRLTLTNYRGDSGDYALVLSSIKQLEEVLRSRLGATGGSLHNLIGSLRALPPAIIAHLHYLRQERNALAHTASRDTLEDLPKYVRCYNEAMAAIEQAAAGQAVPRAGLPQHPARAGPDAPRAPLFAPPPQPGPWGLPATAPLPGDGRRPPVGYPAAWQPPPMPRPPLSQPQLQPPQRVSPPRLPPPPSQLAALELQQLRAALQASLAEEEQQSAAQQELAEQERQQLEAALRVSREERRQDEQGDASSSGREQQQQQQEQQEHQHHGQQGQQQRVAREDRAEQQRQGQQRQGHLQQQQQQPAEFAPEVGEGMSEGDEQMEAEDSDENAQLAAALQASREAEEQRQRLVLEKEEAQVQAALQASLQEQGSLSQQPQQAQLLAAKPSKQRQKRQQAAEGKERQRRQRKRAAENDEPGVGAGCECVDLTIGSQPEEDAGQRQCQPRVKRRRLSEREHVAIQEEATFVSSQG